MNAAEQQLLAQLLTNEVKRERRHADREDSLKIAEVDLRRFAAGLAQKRIDSIRHAQSRLTEKRLRLFERDVRAYVRLNPAPLSRNPNADAKRFTRWRLRNRVAMTIVFTLRLGAALR